MLDIEKITDNKIRRKMREYQTISEEKIVSELYKIASFSKSQEKSIEKISLDLISNVRKSKSALSVVQSLMQEYALSDKEGIILMCLAESLLRVPDNFTANKLIKDKLQSGDFQSHIGKGEKWFVNASTYGLVLTGKILKLDEDGWTSVLSNLIKNTSLPVIRNTIGQMMKILGKEFVLGQSIDEALKNSIKLEKKGYRYSYDMLGEGAVTQDDSIRYYKDYLDAIKTIGSKTKGRTVHDRAGISVKISAIHPRYELFEYERVMQEIVPKMIELCKLAKKNNISLFIDAEEMDRTEISLEIIKELLSHKDLADWDGLGFVVQTYGKRASFVIDDLNDMCVKNNRKIMVRLVKGAYWDTEIKIAHEMGLDDFPVFTRKEHSDVSYVACSKKLFEYNENIYSCFATHNALSVATVIEIAKSYPDVKYEFQKLHGMGDYMYHLITECAYDIPTRIYAPVGVHRDLLPYLVRRLLENGANSSFVKNIFDDDIPIKDMVKSPMALAKKNKFTKHPKVQYAKDINNLPNEEDLWRDNSKGIDMTNIKEVKKLIKDMDKYNLGKDAYSIINGKNVSSKTLNIVSPQNTKNKIAKSHFINKKQCLDALESVSSGFEKWDNMDCAKRSKILEKSADIFEKRMADFIKILSLEAGKTLNDCIAEVREGVDFLRYYSKQSQQLLKQRELPGPTGESNTYQLSGRGVFLCISPWNFPFAIFLGQIAGALSVGNTVIAKPAETTSLIAYETIKVLLEAGLPKDAIALLIGEGRMIGDTLLERTEIAGVSFTGSTETAQHINMTLAKRTDGIIPFIAETGGQNAMIVDSSALLEQATKDIVNGAFQSAGQRCSATRLLYVQDEVADNLIKMISGAMDELSIGDPMNPATDVGPVIDEKSLEVLKKHQTKMDKKYKKVGQAELPDECKDGTFFAPAMYEIPNVNVLEREVFGPILHIVRWKKEKLDDVIDEINGTGYGLTFGIHSRIDSTVDYVVGKMKVGNAYVNRNQIGAMVGQQPFGGTGKSGTGFKAGGPHYLLKFCEEKTVSIDTTASGGNASLMAEV